jgi:protease-4
MDRPLGPEIADVVQLAIDDGYEDFLARVGKARKMTREQVDRIARGRVWSGEDAQRLGLVDHMGSLSPAISSAATRARLPKDHRVWYVERERSLKERLLSQLLAFSTRVFGPGPWAAAARPDETTLSPVLERLASAARELERLALWNDPRGLYAHCLCSED